MEFTNEEIALCKKIAEKYRKEIKKGDYFAGEIFNPTKNIKAYLDMIGDGYAEVGNKKYSIGLRTENNTVTSERQKTLFWFPLWQISDCLEFLRERCYVVRLSYQRGLMDKDMKFSEYVDGDFIKKEIFIRGYYFMEKPLEALLKGVLAILEKTK